MIHSYSGDLTPLLENVLNIKNAETIKDEIKINETKSNIINFNFSSTNTPLQNLTPNDSKIVSVDGIKLLGVTHTSDLRW